MAEQKWCKVPFDEYVSLLEDSFRLSSLDAGGVDNWDGVTFSHEESGYFDESEKDEPVWFTDALKKVIVEPESNV